MTRYLCSATIVAGPQPWGWDDLSKAEKQAASQLDAIEIDWLAKDNKKPTQAVKS